MKTQEEQIKTLKGALIAAIVLIVLLSGMIVANKVALNKYEHIDSGTYYTEKECEQKYGFTFAQNEVDIMVPI